MPPVENQRSVNRCTHDNRDVAHHGTRPKPIDKVDRVLHAEVRTIQRNVENDEVGPSEDNLVETIVARGSAREGLVFLVGKHVLHHRAYGSVLDN